MSFNIIDADIRKTNYSDPHTYEIIKDIITPEVEREKREAEYNHIKWAKENQKLGPQQQEGLGQKLGSIDFRVWLRWQQEVPGCWGDPGFVKQFLAANPECAAPTSSHG